MFLSNLHLPAHLLWWLEVDRSGSSTTALYVGLPLESIWKLQPVQNAAARLLTGGGGVVTAAVLATDLFLGQIQGVGSNL